MELGSEASMILKVTKAICDKQTVVSSMVCVLIHCERSMDF